MNATTKIHSAFLDTSALFAGIWSEIGAAHMVLKLGEAGLVRLLVSPQVLAEIERVVRTKAPDALPSLVVLLDHSGIQSNNICHSDKLEKCRSLVDHNADAHIAACAWSIGVDYLITLDKAHFLDNRLLQAGLPFPVGTPGDFLLWLRSQTV